MSKRPCPTCGYTAETTDGLCWLLEASSAHEAETFAHTSRVRGGGAVYQRRWRVSTIALCIFAMAILVVGCRKAERTEAKAVADSDAQPVRDSGRPTFMLNLNDEVVGTMSDMMLLKAAMTVMSSDRGEYGVEVHLPKTSDFAEVHAALVPRYAGELPQADRWGTPFKYGDEEMRLTSAAADREFNSTVPHILSPNRGMNSDPGLDIILDRSHPPFLQHPKPGVVQGSDDRGYQIIVPMQYVLRNTPGVFNKASIFLVVQGLIANTSSRRQGFDFRPKWTCLESGEDLKAYAHDGRNANQETDLNDVPPGAIRAFQVFSRPLGDVLPSGCTPVVSIHHYANAQIVALNPGVEILRREASK